MTPQKTDLHGMLQFNPDEEQPRWEPREYSLMDDSIDYYCTVFLSFTSHLLLEINTPFLYGLDKPEFMGRTVNVLGMLVSYMVMLFATTCA